MGYEYVDKRQFLRNKDLGLPVFTEQYPVGNGIYGKPMKCDFMLYHPERWPDCLVIESKWQQSGGSVDQKFPFLVLCIEASGYQSIIVLDGGGYSEGAEAWLRNQAGSKCLKHVFSMSEIQRFANEGRL